MASGDEASHTHPSGRIEDAPVFAVEHGGNASQKHSSSRGIPRALRYAGDFVLVIVLLTSAWLLLTSVWHLYTNDVTIYFKYAHDF